MTVPSAGLPLGTNDHKNLSTVRTAQLFRFNGPAPFENNNVHPAQRPWGLGSEIPFIPHQRLTMIQFQVVRELKSCTTGDGGDDGGAVAGVVGGGALIGGSALISPGGGGGGGRWWRLWWWWRWWWW